MAAKLLHSLADENPDLQKQIGCMTGIFQIFDRQHVLSGRHISQNRLLTGNSRINGSDLGGEYIIHHRDPDTEMSENGYQKQRAPIELSRPSFSSTCSSSFSSVECNKAAQLESSSYDQIMNPHEMPMRDLAKNRFSQFGRNPHDFRDVVKGSIYRDPRTFSDKKLVTGEALSRSAKLRDSPRPSQFSESKQIDPVDLQESLRVLAKLRDVPWQYEEAKSKNSHRFSYDGREINRLSFESRDGIRSSHRHSLDSRERPMNGSHLVSITSQNRPPSVVAKLMGLESLPESTIGNETLSKSSSYSSSFDEKSSIGRVIIPDSPSSSKGPNSQRLKNPNLIMKPALSSKFPNEAAPWRHLDGSGGSSKSGLKLQNPAKTPAKTPAKATISVPSVYSEIDKRLKELEFSQSGKDLRALKQILEAMQTKGLLDSSQKTQKDCSLISGNVNHDHRGTIRQNFSSSSEPDSSRVYESPIVIMKPAKLVEKSDILASSAIHSDSRKISRTSRIIKDNRIGSVTSSTETRTSSRNVKSRIQQLTKENTGNSTKSSGSSSPRLQQKKPETERRSRPPAPPSDPKQIRRTSNQKVSESGYRVGKVRQISSNSLQSDDHLSDISNESRTLSYQGDDASLHSESNLSMDSKIDMEVTINEQIPAKFVKYSNPGITGNESSASRFNEYNSEEIAKTTPDYRSPVSILDASVYGDDEHSPVKQNPDPDEYKWSSENIVVSSSTGSEINRKKLQNIDNLVQKLRRLNSHHDEAKTDYIASLCENSDPDRRYISEILLASGLLLRDLCSGLTTFQLHPSGHPINPELFFVLEQTKTSKLTNSKSNHDKFHRKLIFDAVNEILAKRLAIVGPSSEPWLKRNKLVRKTSSAQKILKELCVEIEQFNAKKSEGGLDWEEDGLKNMLVDDVMVRSGRWPELDGEIPSFVLDLERSIFKDLVDEIVIGEKIQLRAKSGRCKQLFGK